MSPEEFCSRLIGRKILSLNRRGKYLIFGLSGKLHLIIHLRMTGALLWNPHREEPFSRVEFLFDKGARLIFSDIRRFGTIYLVRNKAKIICKLGVEPLGSKFTATALAKLLGSRTGPIKPVLLNQELIAGIGNMYADEALFKARIHPQRPASSLKGNEIKLLHDSIIKVLEKGIKNKGASIRDYRAPNGAMGSAHKEFAVAHRGGEKCPSCGTAIKRIVVGQRGTYYCPVCQTLSV
jgi:formamidopyrimidine-DNA glycosylase